MNTSRRIALLLVILSASVGWLAWQAKQPTAPGEPITVSELQATPTTPTSSPMATAKQPSIVAYKVETFTQNLKVPWSLVFTAPNRMLVTERPGRVRAIIDGKLQANPIRTFSEVSNESEEGLMGMVMDPQYATNKYVYLCIAYGKDPKFDKVVRVTDAGDTLKDDTIIFDKIPSAEFHAGCRLHFGPDGKLYVSTGDATDRNLAQDLSSWAGKILRLNADGSFPSDNPFANSPIYTYGHRNPQGFDWNPVTGTLVEVEHGPSGFDGPGGGDEVNILKKGHNYGWPTVHHEQTKEGMDSPLLQFTPAVAPASGIFYRGSVFPQFTNTFFAGLLKGEGILHVVFDLKNTEKIATYERLPGIDVGRVRDIVEGPDGFIYFTTSNQDGRGKVRSGDDKIYRIVPEK